MDDLISRQTAIEMLCDMRCGCKPKDCGLTLEQDGAEECADVRWIMLLPSAPTSRIEKILHGKSPKEQFKIIERIFATGRYWTDSRQAISDWFDGKEMPLFDYYIGRHD